MARLVPPKPYVTTAPYTVTTCPVCSEPIKADVTLEVSYGEAIVHSADNVTLQADTKLTGFSLIHECSGPPAPDADAAAGVPA